MKEFYDYPVMSVPGSGASNTNMISRIPVTKNKQNRRNMEPRMPKDSTHAEPGYNNPNKIRTANHPLKKNCER